MLGFLVIYFIWKYFSELALEHNKNKWGFAILGIVSFYFGSFLLGVLLAVSDVVFKTDFVEGTSELTLTLIGFPVGLLSCWSVYLILKKSWSKKASLNSDEALDEQFLS